MRYASEVVKQAKAWLGKRESNGSHKEIIDVYNAHKPLARNYKVKYNDAWCATFVSAVAIKLGYTDIIPTECGCESMVNLFKNKGCWQENETITPTAGMIIFYDWQDNGRGDNRGYTDHVGIVESVSNGAIIVIEGNNSNSVKRRELAVNGRYIRGYGVPKYNVQSKPNDDNGTMKTSETIAKEVVQGLWGNGSERKAKIEAAGYDYNIIQTMVNQIVHGKKTHVEIAKEVVQGKWGNGEERKKKLEAAGYNYQRVQDIVNKLL